MRYNELLNFLKGLDSGINLPSEHDYERGRGWTSDELYFEDAGDDMDFDETSLDILAQTEINDIIGDLYKQEMSEEDTLSYLQDIISDNGLDWDRFTELVGEQQDPSFESSVALWGEEALQVFNEYLIAYAHDAYERITEESTGELPIYEEVVENIEEPLEGEPIIDMDKLLDLGDIPDNFTDGDLPINNITGVTSIEPTRHKEHGRPTRKFRLARRTTKE